jgi:acetyl esterase/lipase
LFAGTVAAQSPATVAEYQIEPGIHYLSDEVTASSQYAKEKCRLDLYHPSGVKGFPTVVYFHGGGLTGGSRSIPAALKNRGWAVVGVSYRLSPVVKHPVYIEDAAAALAWTFKNIESYGGDPSKIFVTGISAGGYLTAMVGLDKSYLAKHDIDANRIAALIPVTGQMITHQTVRKEQGIEPSKFRPTIDAFAPLYHVRKDAPPTLCITGGWGVDMLMRAEENLYFVSMMKLVGHKNIRHIVIEGADHGRCGKECWPHVTGFIDQTLAGIGKR